MLRTIFIMMIAGIAATGNAQSRRDPVIYPRPGQPGYSVAKAFVGIVRRDDELNLRALDEAFGLSKFDHGFRWLGPYKKIGKGQSYAFYDPQDSPLGIKKIAINWNDSAVALGSGKLMHSRSLAVQFRPDACPSESEMAEATGAQMKKVMVLGIDGGPPYWERWFNVPDEKGSVRTIRYMPAVYAISIYHIK